MRHLLLFSVVALAACGQAASNAANGSASNQRTFAVAGVAPGMTPAQVSTSLEKAGYASVDTRTNMDFQQAVNRARGVKWDSSGAISEQNFNKKGETVSVNYVPMPEGPVAEMIFYSVPPGVMSRQEVLDEFTKRYGTRSYEYDDSIGQKHVVWCSASKSDCDRTELNLSVQTGYRTTNVFVEDPRQWERQKQAILAAPGRQKATL